MDLLATSMGEVGAHSLEFITVIRLVLAAVCGGILGVERMIKGRPAGLKTFSLVCMGATLVMSTNQYLFLFITNRSGDISRLAAQVISGIGFLGAGTIIVTGANQVKGLTTAAALWVTATIGIAIGSGYYLGAILGTVLVFIISRMFSILDDQITKRSRYMTINAEIKSEEGLLKLMEFLTDHDITIKGLSRKNEGTWYKGDIYVLIDLDFGKRGDHQGTLAQIRKLGDIRFVQEL